MQQETEVFVFPASFAQQRLWFLNQLAPGNPFYNVSTALRLTGSLNFIALEQTFNEIVQRHETLRTTFTLLEGELVQIIAPILTVPLPTIDLQNLSPTQQETAALQLATDAAQCPFDLAAGPLFKVTLLQLGETEHILLLNLHHIVADGWSMGVLIRELGTLYTAFVKNEREAKLSRRESHLPALPVQYADFAEWQHQYLQGEVLETQLDYWREQLKGITALNLPTDRQRPAVPSYRGAKYFITLSPALSEQLKSFSQQESATLFITLLAAFQTLLYRYTGQVDIAVGTPIANRNKSEIEALIGFFVNSLVLRADLSGNPTFRELLHRVKNVAMAAYAHQDLPFEKLVEELHPDRELSRNPLFQISFSLQNTPVAALELPGITLGAIDFDSGTAKLDLECNLWEDAGSIQGQIVYSTDLFDRATIARMAEHFQTLLKAIVANPQQRLSDLALLTAPEYQQLLNDWNDTQRDYPQNQCFHQLFEERVELAPDAVAAVFENQQLTYRQLNSKANQLARYLQQLGAKPEVLIGLCVERSLDAIVGILGIIKAGAAYLPLDPTYPQERLNFMLEDAQVSILLTQQHLAQNLTAPENYGVFTVVCLDSDLEIIARKSPENLTTNIIPENLSYIIYTSGSTGKPKGVLIEHRGLYNLALAQIEAFQISSNHRILQFASLSFDASIFEIVMALGTGATLYCAKKESLLPGQTLIQFLQDNAITHATLPPSLLAVLPNAELPALQTIICAGESCSPDVVKRWGFGRRFFNAYGPTEATVWSSFAEICERKKPPIGRPIANTQLYILDENLQPVPVGVPGELYIGGSGLARGYLNRPELTAQRFIANRFSQKAGERIYKTGDLARYFPDGNIEFLGRTDEQVKIRGYRIELGEIEALLLQHPAVKETAAVAEDDFSGNKRLVAYVVPNQNPTLNPLEMRNFLKQQLPNYMIPSAFVAIDFLPLTPNGKIDRNRLISPENLTSNSTDKSCIAPRTPTESTLAQIWSKILNTEPVGIGDNFFDLGGDSLLAIRLINEINQQFERELPLSALFLNPTIEGLADSLSSETNSLEWSPLVAIKPRGKNPPFFCVHPIFGVVFPYVELAFQLGENQPFYGLQPKGIDGESSPLTRIEEMAADYIAALRTVQPKGPYFLGGWSFGGLVAFEMAQQLLAAGDEVALLAVLDTLAPIAANKPSFWDGCKFILTTVSRSIWPFVVDYFRLVAAAENVQVGGIAARFPKLNKLLNWAANCWHGWNWKQAVMVSILSQESQQHNWRELAIPSMFTVFQANSQATLSYVPKIYPHRITLFRSGEKLSTNHQDPTLGWSDLTAAQVEVIRVPGNHLTMLRKPCVEVLARQLNLCLKQKLSD
ncbi:amino acid adenylation domain-containing protein [Tychonema sp. LEGE 07199]|uniref:non-ribosomal peptide synthetase n=1 Tax=unclassified Tychonema TaxID=2642144 RepID=UPI001880F6B3|nr:MULTISPECIES: non-ribosomal peptide synthetase [unclassified Tychonema]MBE9120013.1 amino acid adenylation domain-containing protein [Tychonema sp. LEGE 07199]MBE9132031.1 amino acid adenylation domain-containing protein [Tychonema sp. LEGE 07196]